MTTLFEAVQLGSLLLANRVFMAPLTRTRADDKGVPSEFAATYYSQRASAGLIVTEATQISPMGKGYSNTPGIHSTDQVRAWSRIVDSVHQNGGQIFLQLWHVGRISHSSLLPNNAQPVAPSAIRANAHTHIATGSAQVSEPVALTASGIKETLVDYRRAAISAKEAGFDGVEIHAANGYLIDQFLRTGTNRQPMITEVPLLIEHAASSKQSNGCSKSGTASGWVCESLRPSTSTTCATIIHSTPSPLQRESSTTLGSVTST